MKETHNSNSTQLLCYISFAPLFPAFQNQRPSHTNLVDEKLGQEELMTQSCIITASFWSGCRIRTISCSQLVMRPPIDAMDHFQPVGCWYYVKYSFRSLIYRIWEQHCWTNQLSSYGQDAMNVGISGISVCD